MAEYKSIVPVLRVVDLNRAIEFYTTILGFKLAWQAGHDGGGENAMLTDGATSLLLSTASHLGHPPHFTGTLYINMIGVDDLFDRVKARVQIVWPLETTSYGQREFGLRDPDGYTLAFAEDLEKS